MKKSILTVFAAITTGCLFSQTHLIELDLSQHEPGKGAIEQAIRKQRVEAVELKNALVNAAYVYKVKVELLEIEVPPFPARAFLSDSDPVTQCAGIKTAIVNARNATEESKMPGLKKELQKQIGEANETACGESIQKAQAIIDHSLREQLAVPLELETCNTLKITVTRTKTDGTDARTWEFELSTPCESPWKIHYGFTFAPNMMNPVSSYYAKADTGGTYLIIRMRNQRKEFLSNFTPTIMFTYRPLREYNWKKRSEDYSILGAMVSNDFYKLGFTGGVGFDLEKPTAMVGPAIIIKENLSLNAGVIFAEKQVLKGQYSAGQRVTEALDFDQLHEGRYMPEWFISIGFRFDRNPFSTDEEETGGEE